MPVKAEYLRENNKEKGFSIFYNGGDYCTNFHTSRTVQFDFECDPSKEIAVTDFFEDQCHYHFIIRSNKACLLIGKNAGKDQGKYFLLYNGGFWSSALSFYLKIGGLIVTLFFSLLYYALICFVIYSLFRIVETKISQ